MKSNNFKSLLGFFLILAIILPGCRSNTSTDTSLVQNSSLKNRVPTQEIFEKNGPDLYQAFQNAHAAFLPAESLSGVVVLGSEVPHNYSFAFFKSLAKKQNYKHFIVLEPLPLTKDQNLNKIFHPITNLKMPTGTLNTDPGLDELISARPDLFQIEDFVNEKNQINTFAPYLQKSFPEATYSLFLIPENVSETTLINFNDFLKQNVPTNSFIVAHGPQSSNLQDSNLQNFQYQYARDVMENFDFEHLSNLPSSQNAAIKAFLIFTESTKKQKANAFKVSKYDEEGQSQPALFEYFMDGPKTNLRSVYLVSFGDIMLGRHVRTLMDKNSLEYPFQKMNQNYLKVNDLLLANLEGPIAKNPMKTSKTIAFRFMPDIAPLLKKYYFDVLSIANNHAFDMGINGFNDTRELIQEQGIKIFGNPKEVNDQSAALVEIQGQKIAFLGLDDVDFKINDEAAINKVKELTQQGFKVIPFIHWGVEYVHKPVSRQQNLAHALIDAGSIAIIGMHPHVVESYETYKNRPIFYSLGNAIFDQYFSNATQEGLSIALIIANDQIQIYFVPIRLDHSQMRLMNPEERQKFLETFVTYGDYSGEEKAAILSGHLNLP